MVNSGIERITNKQLTTHNLEAELRDILHECEEMTHDMFDTLVKNFSVLDLEGPLERETLSQQLLNTLLAKSLVVPKRF
jgi:hypothetical protein